MKTIPSRTWRLLCWVLVFGLLANSASAQYLLLNPPPDGDKPGLPNPPGNDLRCWQFTAANMLAGAGYGTGATLQDRADDIAADLTTQFGLGSGWIDTGLSWWLASGNNTQVGTNPYTVVTVYGNKTKVPWANANGARFIGNELRKPHFTGLSISWPSPGGGASGGHAITAWGDSGGEANLAANPAQVLVTDSDRDPAGTGDVQTYSYDAYNNPNPGMSNVGNGWYFNYGNNHPFIKHIATLSPTDSVTDHTKTQKVVGSYRIHQSRTFQNATDLHYRVGTDVDVLSYRTSIDWETDNSPTILENYQGDERRSLTVDWDLTDNPVPFSNDVTITTEFVVPTWNAIQYSDVRFTYPEFDFRLPEFNWSIRTPFLEITDIPDISGGYVVGSFELIDPRNPNYPALYRFQHEYDFDQNPELHDFSLDVIGQTSSMMVRNLQFGHAYGLLDDEELWTFDQWMSEDRETHTVAPGMSLATQLDWRGMLQYPQGENFTVYDTIPNVPEPSCLILTLAVGLLVGVGRLNGRCQGRLRSP